MTGMRMLLMIGVLAMVTGISCSARKPPLPDRKITAYGQAAAQRFHQGEFDAALRLYLKARNEAARFDVMELQARYMFNVGRVLYECMLFDSAISCFQESALLFSRIERDHDAAMATVFRAAAVALRGNTADAEVLFRKASSHCLAVDSVTVRAVEMLIAVLQGRKKKAITVGRNLLAYHVRARNQFGIGNTYYYLAMVRFAEGDHTTSAALLDSALVAFRLSPYRYRNWRVFVGKAAVAYCRKDSTAGKRFYRQAVEAAPDLVNLPEMNTVAPCPLQWQ